MFWLSAYSENRHTLYKSVVLENNTLETVDIIFISKLLFHLFFLFSDLWNLFKCMDSVDPCYSLLNMKVILLNMVSSPLLITMGWKGEVGGGGDVIRKFAKILWWQNFVLHLWHGKPLRVIQKVSPLRRGGGSLEREQKRTEGVEGEVLAYV